MFDLTGHVAVVTGASSGLGVDMAKGLAGQGANLVLLARRQERLEEVAFGIREEFGVEVLPVRTDVTVLADVQNAVQKTIETFGKVDIVVNNAGSGGIGPAEDMTDEEFDSVVKLDLEGVFRVAREFGKEMLKSGYGRIINISSMYGLVGNRIAPASGYHAAKGGVVNLTKALAVEWASRGVNVNCICPGYFTTDLTQDTLDSPEFTEYMKQTVPLGRYGKKGELNAACVFLASEEASYVTGTILLVDGGFTSL